jgi:hypothetical protein
MVAGGGDPEASGWPAADERSNNMSAERIINEIRGLGYAAMLAVGLTLGAAAPALAETVTSNTGVTCAAVEAGPTGASEWAVPPAPGLPGEPY